MSILGHSVAYYLPDYWSNTPLYGEKLIPLLDYILSTDFTESDKLAKAYYSIANKYTAQDDLPIEAVEEIIDESGYSYVKDLLGNDEVSIRALIHLIVLVNQLKGTKSGIEVVLSLLRKDTSTMVLQVVGNPTISTTREVTNFSENDYIIYSGFTVDSEPFNLTFQVRTGDFRQEQCISSSAKHGYRISIDTSGRIVLSLGNNGSTWNILDSRASVNTLLPNTNYYINFSYTGYEYELTVSTDNKKFTNYITHLSNVPLNLHNSIIYIGVDKSNETVMDPFLGYINLTPFSVNVDNVEIKEWYEETPVGEENTFIIKADLDIGLISSGFFESFAKFVRRYVYPSLGAFDANLGLESNLTFLPYMREKVTYVASADMLTFVPFSVVDGEDPSEYAWFYPLDEDGESYNRMYTLE